MAPTACSPALACSPDRASVCPTTILFGRLWAWTGEPIPRPTASASPRQADSALLVQLIGPSLPDLVEPVSASSRAECRKRLLHTISGRRLIRRHSGYPTGVIGRPLRVRYSGG